MSKYEEDLQIEEYIKHKQQQQQQTISKKDLLKVFDYNLDKLEEVHLKKVKIGNILIDFQLLRGLIESNKIV
tara:strand:+ start:75 stop:290 length:216 start_codon:yes stop_codon:yes gene_type:complete